MAKTIFFDNNTYMNIFPTFNGVFCVSKKKSVLGYVNQKAFHVLETYQNKLLPIKHNIIFLRGIEYLIFGMIVFFKGLVLSLSNDSYSFKVSKAISEKLNISFVAIYSFSCFALSLIVVFLLFGILPSAFSVWFISINKSLLLRNFVIGLVKAVLFLFIVLVLKYSTSFNKIFIFNYACNQVVNSKSCGYKAKNFLNFVIIGFIFSLFMITFLSFEMSPVFKLLYNMAIFFICFSILYEGLNLVDKSGIFFLQKVCGWIAVNKSNQTALLVARSAYWECKMIENEQTEEKKLSVVLAYVQNKLIEAGIDGRLEAQWLVAGTLKKNLNDILFISSISSPEEQNIKKVLERRIKGEPLDKIFGEKEFYGLVFKVNTAVLSPRFETELLVEQVLLNIKDKKVDVLDVCTGSGAIAVAIKKNSSASVSACDISQKALNVAKENAKNNNCKIKFVKSDMFNDLKTNQKYDIIVSNPPYIPTKDIESLDKEVKNYDPKLALDGGTDGLDFYKIIANESFKFLKRDGMLFLEIGIGQADQVKKLLKKYFSKIQVVKDYNNIERIIIARKKDNVR